MQSVDRRSASPGPIIGQTIEPDRPVITVEQNGVRGIIFKDKFRPLVSGGCEMDEDGNITKDCEQRDCFISSKLDLQVLDDWLDTQKKEREAGLDTDFFWRRVNKYKETPKPNQP